MNQRILNIVSGILGSMIVFLFVLNTYQTLTRETSEEALIKQQVEAIKRALCGDIPLEDCNLAETIRQINVNSDQNFLLNCKLFKQVGKDNLTTTEVKDIEKVCKLELERQKRNQSSSSPTPDGSSSAENQNNSNTPSNGSTRGRQNPNNNTNNGGGAPNDPGQKEPVNIGGVPVCTPDLILQNSVCVKEE